MALENSLYVTWENSYAVAFMCYKGYVFSRQKASCRNSVGAADVGDFLTSFKDN